ncbi:hypothetical protein NDU88_007797 [Pleurodeles waltl]|uniref:Uncharacterized protein n=1 Tax=Pleurodeles waltl TaxID=8319 RepID=A0AAV7RQG5_PLEWA|nr:hypothetical protein NDU88_007797 [Pleurodeles waltl]
MRRSALSRVCPGPFPGTPVVPYRCSHLAALIQPIVAVSSEAPGCNSVLCRKDIVYGMGARALHCSADGFQVATAPQASAGIISQNTQ